MKKLILLALFATTMFACGKNDGGTGDTSGTGEKSISISIQQNAETKAILPQMGSDVYPVIASAKVFFLNNSDAIVFQRDLTSAEVASIANTTSTEGGKTITITGIPSSVVSLYIVANTSDGTNSFPEIIDSGSANARLQIDGLQGDAENIPMSGVSDGFVAVSGEENSFTTNVLLEALAARLEIGKVTSENQNGSGTPVSSDITGYKLAGIFINNIRPSVLMNGKPYETDDIGDIRTETDWNDNPATYFESTNTLFPYYTGGSQTIPTNWKANAMVQHCTPANSGTSFYPNSSTGSTNTDPGVTPALSWAFHTAPGVTTQGASSSDVPHVILKLTDVTYNNNPLGESTQYVTISKYMDGNGNEIKNFERGKVYRISDLTFTHNEATNNPYDENITITAKVTVAPWTIVSIEPDWGN